MTTITIEVPNKIAQNFSNKKIITYYDLIEYDNNEKYNFSEEKVSLNELSNFLDKNISNNKTKIC
jgi:hypothetical protein